MQRWDLSDRGFKRQLHAVRGEYVPNRHRHDVPAELRDLQRRELQHGDGGQCMPELPPKFLVREWRAEHVSAELQLGRQREPAEPVPVQRGVLGQRGAGGDQPVRVVSCRTVLPRRQ